MKDVEHGGVEEHDGCFEDIEEPFVGENGRDVGVIGGVDVGRQEVFDGAVDGSDCNQRAAGHQDDQRTLDLGIENPTAGAIKPEIESDGDETCHLNQLEDEGCFQERFSCLPYSGRVASVGQQGGAIGRDGLNDHPKGDEGGENPSGVDR